MYVSNCSITSHIMNYINDTNHGVFAYLGQNWDDLTHNEKEEVTKYFQSKFFWITASLNDITRFWCGHHFFGFNTLTPDCLTSLKMQCETIWDEILKLTRITHGMLGLKEKDLVNMSANDYAKVVDLNQFEIELMKVILESFELSSGEHVEPYGDIDEVYVKNQYGYRRDLLRVFQVTPWEPPVFPEVVVPERPSVILKVLSLSKCAPRVSAGLDDVFYTEPIVRELLVDEDVQVGDHIIVKTSGWPGFGLELIKPEYDGLAEDDCPCSSIDAVFEAKYDFSRNLEKSRQKLNWLNTHFVVLSNTEIYSKGYDCWHTQHAFD